MKKRILVVASTFPASNTDSVPAFVKDQIIAFKKHNPELDLLVLAPHDARSNTLDFQKHNEFKEYRFHYMWPHSLEKLAGRGGIMPALKQNKLNYLLIPFLFIGEFVALLSLVRKSKPDVIYAHWFTPQAVLSRFVATITNTPFIFTTHASDVDVWHKIPLIGELIVRSTTPKSKAITAVSSRSLAKLERFFTPDVWVNKIKPFTKIIPMGVTMDINQAPENEATLKQKYDLQDKTVLFFMGRLAEKKGVSYLLEAFSRIANDDVRLVIAGDGPLRSSLEQQTIQLGLSDIVRFTGYLSGDEKQDYLKLTDIMVLPSIITDDGDAEGLPVVFMEGLSAGKVCIATNESGADNIIENEKSGFLLPHKDSIELQKVIEKALDIPEDVRKNIQQEARHTAKQFDWTIIAKQHLDFFAEKLGWH